MQVSVESMGGLQKRLTVQVPSGEIDEQVDTKLRSLSFQVKVDGFRKGKVPFKVMQQRFDSQVRQEVLEEVIQKTYYEALSQEKLRPAGKPNIEPSKNKEGDFEYSATFEIYPEIELNSCEGEAFEKVTAKIQATDVAKTLEKLQVARVTWKAVERKAKLEDQVVIDFEGKIEGELLEGGQADNHPLVLGSGTMIPGFEDQLVGVVTDEKKTLELSFPDDYAKKELAAKAVSFAIEVKSVSEPVLPELDDEFAKSLGVPDGGIDTLRNEVKDNMQLELDKKLKSMLKESVLDVLISKNEIDLPKSLVEQETNALMQQYIQSMQNSPELASNQFPIDQLADQAKKRVTLGLLLGEVISKNNISADSESGKARMDAILNDIASTYDDPAKVIAEYREKKEAMDGIRSMVLEDEVVDHLLSSMNVSEKSSSFDEVMNPPQS